MGRIRWDLGRMFFLNGVHNSKQSRAPCTKGTKNLKIQKFRKQRKDTGILDKTTNEGTLAENALRHGPRQEVDIYYNIRIQECKNNIREYTQYQCHRSHMGRGPQLFKMGTWFWVKWWPKDFDMNSFQNVFSACVDEQLLESGGKIGTWTSLSFLGQERGPKNICSKIETNCGWSLLAKQNDIWS